MYGIDFGGSYFAIWLFPIGFESYYLSSTKSLHFSFTIFKVQFKFVIGENYTLFDDESI